LIHSHELNRRMQEAQAWLIDDRRHTARHLPPKYSRGIDRKIV